MANDGQGKFDPWNQNLPGGQNTPGGPWGDVLTVTDSKGNPIFPGGIPIGPFMDLFGLGNGTQPPLLPNGATQPPQQQPGRTGSNLDWQDLLRQFQQISGLGQGFAAGPSATPGAPGMGGAGLKTNVNGADFLRFLPGFQQMGPIDPSSLYNLAAQSPNMNSFAGTGGGGRGAGGAGGGPGAQGGAVGDAQRLLAGYFGGPAPTIDPRLQGGIDSLQGQSAAQYGAFPGMIGGAQDPIMALIMRELGGSAAAGQSFGGGGGGGGGAMSLPYVDISLKGISPEAQALIDSQTKARTGALDLSRKASSGQALADLFGRGVERSSIAQDRMGRLQYGHEQALQEALAAGSEQTLGAMLADQQARTELGKAQLSAAAQSASAAASSAASGFAAQSQLAGQRMGLLGDIFGNRSSALASAFGSQQAANTGFAGILGDVGLGQLDAAGTRANSAVNLIDSQNSLRAAFNAAAQGRASAADVARIGQQTALANLPFENQLAASQFHQSEAARIQQGILSLLGIDLDRYLGDTAASAQRYSADRGRPSEPSFLDRLLGIGGTLGAAWLGRG